MSEILLPTGYQQDVRTCKILTITGCQFLLVSPIQPHCCLRDIAPSEILLPARYCYQRGIATSEILLPARYCYQRDIATSEILRPARYCYQRDSNNNTLKTPTWCISTTTRSPTSLKTELYSGNYRQRYYHLISRSPLVFLLLR